MKMPSLLALQLNMTVLTTPFPNQHHRSELYKQHGISSGWYLYQLTHISYAKVDSFAVWLLFLFRLPIYVYHFKYNSYPLCIYIFDTAIDVWIYIHLFICNEHTRLLWYILIFKHRFPKGTWSTYSIIDEKYTYRSKND